MKQFRMRPFTLERTNANDVIFGASKTLASSTVLGVDQVNIETKKLGVA